MKNINECGSAELRMMLYNKAVAEQYIFIENLKRLPPEKIIEASYENVIRDELLMIFESKDFSREQVKELLKSENLLAKCYDYWLDNEYLDNDCVDMNMLVDTVNEFADKLIEQAAQQKN